MNIHFQPKIILGSVIGFVATAIGVIAVFFPSLFNLEQKKIANYSYTLNSLSDANKFIDFLKDHQNGIVHFNLTYIENERYIDAVDKNGNIIFDENAEMDGTPAKDDLNKKCLNTPGDGIEGNTSYATVDKDGYIFIRSEFKCKKFLNDFNFLRTKGGLGIWIHDDNSDSNDKTYRIIIKDNSNKNTLFKWSIKNREKNLKEMELSGTFFVSDFIDSHNYDNDSSETIESMSPKWRDNYSGLDQIGIDNIYIIELLPLSKKEIESKNY